MAESSANWCLSPRADGLILKIWEEQTFESLWVLPEIIFNSFLSLLGGPWVNDPGCLRCWGPAVCWWLLLANFGLRLSFKVLYIWFFFRDKYVGNHKPDVLLSLSVKVFLLPPKSKYQLYGWSPWHFLVQEISWPVSSGSCCSLQDVWILFYKSDWSGAHGTWDRGSMHV